MIFYVYDGDSWLKHADLAAAEASARTSLEAARESAQFDREWPDWVDDICVRHGADGTEEPDNLPCVLKAVQTNVQRPSSELDEDGYDSDYEWWEAPDACRCDYDLAKPESI